MGIEGKGEKDDTMQDQKSREAYQRAGELIPGGVNSPVRAARAVGRDPLFLAKGQGAYLWDIDGNRFIDYVGSWGPMLLGHAHPAVLEAVFDVLKDGLSFGAPTERETELAGELCAAMPSMDMVRLVNSGTEATMSALRLARAATGRNLIVKFEGCYHGHSDGLLVKAGSGALTLGVPTSAGVPEQIAGQTLVASFNDTAALKALFENHGEHIAAVIVEPVAGNMGVVLPQEGFLPTLRSLTKEYGSLLIFDEVMTGFRLALGGAQAVYNIDPDLSCLGKVIGGGLPLAAYGGKAYLMELIAPSGPVYQAGTLSGNPLAAAAGLATIREIKQPGFYEALEAKTERLAEGIRTAAAHCRVPVQVNSRGAMLSAFFTEEEVMDYASACSSDTEAFSRFYRAMLEAGIYLPPSQFEAWFISTAHSDEDIEATLLNIEKILNG